MYNGMHSTADVIGGSLMGIGCWALWRSVGDASERWVNTGTSLGKHHPELCIKMNTIDGEKVPIIAIPLTLALVHYHPEPVDDCPCFEDAIAILAVFLGSYLGHWYHVNHPWMSEGIDKVIFDRGLGKGIAICLFRVIFGMFPRLTGIH